MTSECVLDPSAKVPQSGRTTCWIEIEHLRSRTLEREKAQTESDPGWTNEGIEVTEIPLLNLPSTISDQMYLACEQ